MIGILKSTIIKNHGRFIEALEELEVSRYAEDSKINALVEQFERFAHSDLLEEIKSLKVHNLTM